MCGRYSLTSDVEELTQRFDVPALGLDYGPRYNVAPTQKMPVITGEGTRRIEMMQWGLVPFWAKAPTIGSRLINARVETVEQKPSFRHAVRKQRCIVPADGYYEWQPTPTGKQPMRIVLPSREPFGMAGLWEEWNGENIVLRTYTILTTEPRPELAHIHDRMPLVLRREQEEYWLNGLSGSDSSEVRSFLDQLETMPGLTAYPVSTRVNSPRNDDASLIAAL